MTLLACSDYLENKIVDHMLRGQAHTPTANVYLAVCSSATSDSALGTEASGSGYARPIVTFGAPSLGVATNSAAASSTFPVGTWTHAAVMDAVTGGNILFHGPLTTSRTTTIGQTVIFSVGDISVGFSSASSATDYLRNAIINRFLRNQAWTPPTIYAGAYTTDTTRLGGGTEATGSPYARQTVTLAAPSGGVTSNSNTVEIPVPAGTYTNMAILDALTAGNMLLESTFTGGNVVAGAGDILRFPIGDYDLVVT